MRSGRIVASSWDAEVEERLRQLLGSSADDALPGLKLGADLYLVARHARRSRSRAKRQLCCLDAALQRLEEVFDHLSTDTLGVLEQSYDWEALRRGEEPITAAQALAAAIRQCQLTHSLVKIARSGTVNSPITLLTYSVAGALEAAGKPISKRTFLFREQFAQ